jgi:hypothetical protein
VAHFEHAVAYNSRIGARPYAALALHDHAALLGDRNLAAQAVDAYAALGMDVVAGRAAALVDQP